MEKTKQFIEKLLAKEAECWTRLDSNDLDAFNPIARICNPCPHRL